MLKLLFAGTPQAAVPTLEALAADTEHFQVMAVLTRPDAVRGRGRKLTASPVKEAALKLGIPVLEGDPKEPTFLDALKATGAEAGAIVAYGKILRQPVLDALPKGWYNLHFSLLPQWRGAAPVQRAIWAGDSLTGATVFRLTAGMDTGPILAQSTLEIGAHDTSGDVLQQLSQDGSRLMTAALQAMASGQIVPQEQPHGAFETAQKITAEDAHIRFDVPAFAADRQIRACTPDPGAWCMLHTVGRSGGQSNAPEQGAMSKQDNVPEQGDPAAQGSADAHRATGSDDNNAELFHILHAHVVQLDGEATAIPEQAKSLEPGHLLATKKHVWVGTRSQPLELDEVKVQGKKAMAAADWARGARLATSAYVD